MTSNFFLKLFPRSDIFVSYRWSPHGKPYALRLAEELEKRGLTCYIDEKGLSRGEIVPASLRNAIRKSKMFVLVASDDLHNSTWVPKEIALAEEFNRKIVPVNVQGTLERLPPEDERWLPLKDRSRIEETVEAHREGVPSKHVAEKIDQAYTFTRTRVSAIRWLFLTGSVFFLLSVAAFGLGFFALKIRDDARVETQRLGKEKEQLQRDIDQAQLDKEAAETAAKNATTAKTSAEKDRDVALSDKQAARTEAATARSASLTARAEATRARGEKAQADIARDLAVSAKLEATAEATRQTARADEQKKLAEAASRQRQQALSDVFEIVGSTIDKSLADLELLQPAVDVAFQNYSKWNPANLPIPDQLHVALTDAAVNTKAQGSSLGVGSYPQVEEFDISPIGSLMVAVGYTRPENSHKEQTAAMLWDVRSRQLLWEMPATDSQMTACAISLDSSILAVGFENGEVKFFTVSSGNVSPLRSVTFPKPVVAAKFTPAGKLIINYSNGDRWTGKSFFLVDPRGGDPRPIPLPDKVSIVDFGNGRRELKRLQQAPAFIATLDSGDQLTIVETATGKPLEVDLNQTRILPQTDGPYRLRDSALSPNGRWFLVIPTAPDKRPRTPYLVDVHCAADKKSKCTPAYALPSIYAHRDPQITFDPNSEFVFVGEAKRELLAYKIEAITANPKAESRSAFATTTPGEFTIMGFSTDAKQIVLKVNNGRQADPRELQTFSFAPPYERARYSLDADQLFWRNLILKQAQESDFLVGLAGSTIHIWEKRPAPGFSLLSYPSSVATDIGPATDATISPDGQLVASAHPSGKVALWRLADRTLIGVISGLSRGRVLIEWGGTADTFALFVASQSGQLLKWMTNHQLIDFNVPPEVKEIGKIQVVNQGRTVAVHGLDGSIAVWRDQKWRLLAVKQRPLALSSDGLRLAVPAGGGGVNITDLDGQNLIALKTTQGFLRCDAKQVSFAMSDTRVVTESCNGLTVWDSSGGPPLTKDRNARGETRVSVPQEATGELWARFIDGYTNIVDLQNGQTLARIPWRGSSSEKGPEIKLTGEPEGVSTSLGGESTVFDFSRSAGLLAAGVALAKDMGTMQVWSLKSGEAVSYLPFSANTRRVQFLPEGDALLVVSPQGVPVIVPFDTHRQLLTLCPLFWSKINVTEQSAAGPYDFCGDTFEQAKSAKHVQAPPVWVREAAPRSR